MLYTAHCGHTFNFWFGTHLKGGKKKHTENHSLLNFFRLDLPNAYNQCQFLYNVIYCIWILRHGEYQPTETMTTEIKKSM